VLPLTIMPTNNADQWAAAVAEAWANDWNDPREDIYTLEHGKPLDR
jgi:hypothetical protein